MHRFRPLLLPVLSLGLLLAACGSPEEQTPPAESTSPATPYGTVAEVSAYLNRVEPYVLRIGQLQSQYETALADARQGASDRRGTGENLAAKAEEVLPGLRQVLTDLDAMEPPALLAPFHRDTRKMLSTRIESLEQTRRGWRVEQEGGDFTPIYREAEASYTAANELIAQLNAEHLKIRQALEKAGGAG